MNLEDARSQNRCRICEEIINVEALPKGWKDRFNELLHPIHLILDFGKEFAHANCLPKDKNKNKQCDKGPLSNWGGRKSLRHWGDCQFWQIKICDCGLLRRLLFHYEERRYYKNFWDELTQHENRIEFLREALKKDTDNILGRWEKFISEKGVHYQLRACDGCGTKCYEALIVNKEKGTVITVSQLFNNARFYCNGCSRIV